MIRLEKVNKYFNKRKKNEIHVISDTTISFPKQGLIALLGPSGSGKTTLLNAIGGLDKISSGKIFVGDDRISKRRAGKIDKIRNAKIGYIFQNYNLLDNKTVFENVAIVLRMIGIKNKDEISKRVEYALNLVGMYRYRNRFADMLSGGERQRVGIARAIVKNPSIIIADEPTGNLDSKNTLEVMNIIKSISKQKLVILVTHEEQLAEFYSDRTVKLKDGKVMSDEKNINDKNLDYRMDHRIYLKDMSNHETLEKDDCKIDIYTDKDEKIELNIVARGGNIYLQCLSDNKHMEIVDEHSAIELIDDHYREMTKEEQEKYNFDPNKLGQEGDGKHSSIVNIFSAIGNGFKTLRDYSILKKILLAGFFISAIFVVYSISNIAGITNIDDSKFVNDNKDYLRIKSNKIAVSDYLMYEQEDSVNYLLPGNGQASFQLPFDEYLQTYGRSATLNGSLSSLDTLTSEDIVAGRMPQKNDEIVIDKLVYKKISDDEFSDGSVKMAGMGKAEDLLGRHVELKHMPNYYIVGITDKQSPCIYAKPKQFINIMANSQSEGEEEGYMEEEMMEDSEEGGAELVDIKLMKKDIKLEKGRMPKKEYEVLVNRENEEEMKLNKEIPEKVNGKKLLVVGYYSPLSEDMDYRFVTKNTIKINLINTNKNATVAPNDKDEAKMVIESEGLNVVDTYQFDKTKYEKEVWPMIKSTVIMAIIIIIVSFIEILLMMRASFLSRIKEIGTLRAIGVKKSDIYKIFAGEIVAITVLASLPGYIFMTYIVDKLTNIPYLKEMFMINLNIFVIGIVGILVFNLIVGLLPVFFTMRKTPAAILARTDVQ